VSVCVCLYGIIRKPSDAPIGWLVLSIWSKFEIEFAHISDEEGNTTLELMLLSLACISSIFSIRRCGCWSSWHRCPGYSLPVHGVVVDVVRIAGSLREGLGGLQMRIELIDCSNIVTRSVRWQLLEFCLLRVHMQWICVYWYSAVEGVWVSLIFVSFWIILNSLPCVSLKSLESIFGFRAVFFFLKFTAHLTGFAMLFSVPSLSISSSASSSSAAQ